MSISCVASGLVDERSGIGVLQRAVYPILTADGIQLSLTSSRDRGSSPFGMAVGLSVGILTRPSGDVFLAMAPPLALNMPAHTRVVSLVYDLRWLRTRGRVGRKYRDLDLRHTIRRSTSIIVISDRTRIDLVERYPKAAHKVHTIHLGPGQVRSSQFGPKRTGKVALVGGAPHKRNELAARLIASAGDWVSEVVAISVSPETLAILRRCEPRISVVSYERPDWAVLQAQLVSSEYFVHLGLDEGFGLPYLEALALGCQVIAIDQPLTQEVLADAGVLLSNASEAGLQREFRHVESVAEEIRRRRAELFSWESCGAKIAALIRGASPNGAL